jgi:hypothetical protein
MRIRNNIRVDRDRPGAHSIAGSYNEKWGCAFPLNKKPELDRAGSAESPCGKIRGSFQIAKILVVAAQAKNGTQPGRVSTRSKPACEALLAV